jgi:general secretion pathway protein C
MIARMTTTALQGMPSPDVLKGLLVAHGPQIATWALALGLGVQGAVLVTDIAGSDLAVAVDSETMPPPARLDVAALVGAQLFGQAEVATPSGDGSDAPPTSMALVLTGVLANSDPKTGIAILGESAATAKVFMIGDMVPGGARLNAVYPDRVVLERAGALESLLLPQQRAAMMASAPAAPMPAQRPTAGDVQILDRMRRMIESDPGMIGDVMRPQPVFAEGKQRGYRVYPGRNRAAFSRLGLRPGDLVTAINGTPLDDPARGNEIFSTLGSSAQARVTVMRSGREQELVLDMGQIAAEAEQLGGPPPLPDAAQAALDGGTEVTPDIDLEEQPVNPPTENRGD